MGIKRNQFAIIGMGQFGNVLARQLVKLGKEVMVIDIKEDNIAAVQDIVTHSVVADATDEKVLKALSISSFDVVVVSIGNNMQASILATLLCKQLGVEMVVAKAKSDSHRTVLQRIGADMVILPEEYMGKKLASLLINPTIGDIVDLNEDFSLAEVKVPTKWFGKSLMELNIRKNYNVSIILVKSEDGSVTASPGGDTILKSGDYIMLCGDKAEVEKLSNKVLVISEKE